MTEPTATRSSYGRPRTALGSGGRRRAIVDKTARWVVVAGGFAIIASILGILVFILAEVWPMTRGAHVEERVHLEIGPVTGVATDEYVATAIVIDADGIARGLDLADGNVLFERPLLGPSLQGEEAEADEDPGPPGIVEVTADPRAKSFAVVSDRGSLILVPYEFDVAFEGSERTVAPRLDDPIEIPLAPEGGRVGPFSATRNSDGTLLVAAIYEDAEGADRLVYLQRRADTNLFTGEVTWKESRHEVDSPEGIDRLRLSSRHRLIAGSTTRGELLLWPLEAKGPGSPRMTPGKGSAITSLELLLGGFSLVAGHADGSLEIWFPVRGEGDAPRQLQLVRSFPGHDAAITHIAPSWRNKSFLTIEANGSFGFYHSTSHRTLWHGTLDADGADELLFAPKGNAALVGAEDGLHLLEIHAPHGDISLKSLFAKVWYESYQEPEFVWQSSSATDDFEPKLSLVPLLYGTLKGTFYSLLLAVPLGVFGAMYTSQFLHPNLKRVVKPTVEIMAALPSVVLGFLAGLWLAPRLEQGFTGLLLMLVFIPIAIVLTGLGWSGLPAHLRNKAPGGAELLLYSAVIVAVTAACLLLEDPIEASFFGGSFPNWIVETTGTPYDQRNAIVVGLAMGFAVIPIIFSVAEDAFSNVPQTLVAGSLALGASRWQTVTRVVLPTASPGIFSAIMIGFGRAVGETMIVLMATGNTPIMDWNPFNGFRTLSANIAVEIPEAPVGGTLYRTLFLSALLLFVLTFLINTVAEIVRHRLRRRYANL